MRWRELGILVTLLAALSGATELAVLDPALSEAGLLVSADGAYLDVREVLAPDGAEGGRAAFSVPLLVAGGRRLVLDPTALPDDLSPLVALEAYSCPRGPVEGFRSLDGCKRREPTRITGRLLAVGERAAVEENATGERFLLMSAGSDSVVIRYRVAIGGIAGGLDPSFQLSKPYIRRADAVTMLFEEGQCATWSVLAHTLRASGVVVDEPPGLVRLRGSNLTGGYVVGFGLTSCETVRSYIRERYLSLVDEPSVRALATAVALQANSSSVERQAEEIYYFVRDSINYKFDRFEADKDLPEPPNATLATRLGDCDDMAILLISMLRSIGLDAKLVLMDLDRTGTDFTMRDMVRGGSLAFDHVAVIAGLNPESPFSLDGARIMDPTCKDCLFGKALVEGAPSLVIDGGGGIFPAFSTDRCEGTLCDRRCWTGAGRCCPAGEGEAWRAGRECCSSADCLGNALCEGGLCRVCDGRICAGACYPASERERPCCSGLDCGWLERCERHGCALDRERLALVLGAILGVAAIGLGVQLARKAPCPHCGARISARATFCNRCGERVPTQEERARRAEEDAIERYAAQCRKRGVLASEVSDQLVRRGYDASLVREVLRRQREEGGWERARRAARAEGSGGERARRAARDEAAGDEAEEARRYARTRRDEGFSDDSIRRALERQGYGAEAVESAMAEDGAHERIKRYVAARRREGFSDREIQDALARSGYEARDVREALAPLGRRRPREGGGGAP